MWGKIWDEKKSKFFKRFLGWILYKELKLFFFLG